MLKLAVLNKGQNEGFHDMLHREAVEDVSQVRMALEVMLKHLDAVLMKVRSGG